MNRIKVGTLEHWKIGNFENMNYEQDHNSKIRKLESSKIY
jgi:hypothetical protein